jgi:hypothetical protein
LAESVQEARQRSAIIAPLCELIDKGFEKLLQDARQNGWPSPSLKVLQDARESWSARWVVEFACDALATCWVGPAFGWTNLRVCANMSSDLYLGGELHPADAARTTLIKAVLERLGETHAAVEIEQEWQSLAQISGQSEPPGFQQSYPAALLQTMADRVVQMSRELGCLPYSGSVKGSNAVRDALNAAWAAFRKAPDAFAEYEKGCLIRLREQT